MIKQFAGKVTAPPDMMGAARKSLAEFPGAFEDLMQQTGGRAPSPAELCKMVDGCRQAGNHYAAAISATLPAFSSDMTGTVQ